MSEVVSCWRRNYLFLLHLILSDKFSRNLYSTNSFLFKKKRYPDQNERERSR